MAADGSPLEDRAFLWRLPEHLDAFAREGHTVRDALAVVERSEGARARVAALSVALTTLERGRVPRRRDRRLVRSLEEARRHFRAALFDVLYAYALHEFNRFAEARGCCFESQLYSFPSPRHSPPAQTAARLAESLDVDPGPEIDALQALVWPDRDEEAHRSALQVLRACERLRPGAVEVAQTRLYLSVYGPEEAWPTPDAWESLLPKCRGVRDEAAVQHGLAMALLREGRQAKALEAEGKILLLRPDWSHTFHHLALISWSGGDVRTAQRRLVEWWELSSSVALRATRSRLFADLIDDWRGPCARGTDLRTLLDGLPLSLAEEAEGLMT